MEISVKTAGYLNLCCNQHIKYSEVHAHKYNETLGNSSLVISDF